MPEIVHEHHEDSSSNSILIAVVIILLLAIAGFLIWRLLPVQQPEPEQPGVNLDIKFPSGSSGDQSGSNPTY